ncbi:hypothetical protein A2U01_0052848, partial [Trifolium medium]|nr:hypothetical protein [Trifolium medium]
DELVQNEHNVEFETDQHNENLEEVVVNDTSDDNDYAVTTRIRKPPGHLSDCVTGSEAEKDNESHSSGKNPTTHDEAVKFKVWKDYIFKKMFCGSGIATSAETRCGSSVNSVPEFQVESLAPVARLETVRPVVTIANQVNGQSVQQDVKSAFVN